MSIAILVALLWTCVIAERLIFGHAAKGATEVMRAMRELRLKNRRQPAALPIRPSRVRPPVKLG